MAASRSLLKKQGKPNIVVLVIDCGRPDHFSSYGYYRQTTPNIDRLAAGGILFENAYTVDTASPLAHFALMSGQADWKGRDWLASSGLGGRLWFLWRRILRKLGIADYVGGYDHGQHSLVERLNAAGYLTVGLSANQLVSPRTLVPYRGFAHYPEEALFAGLKDDPAIAKALERYGIKDTTANRQAVYLTADRVMDLAMDTISTQRTNDEQPFFLFMNVMDCHDPYLVHPSVEEDFGFAPNSDFNGDMRNRPGVEDGGGEAGRWVYAGDLDAATVDLLRWNYDRCLRYVDAQVGRLMDWLAERGEDDNTVFFVLADHAELLGEHGLFGHSLEPTQEQMHIPLIVSGADYVKAGGRQAAPASIVDIRPSIFELIGASDPFLHRSGQSLFGPRQPTSALAFLGSDIAERREKLTGQEQAGISAQEQELLEQRLRDLGYMD